MTEKIKEAHDRLLEHIRDDIENYDEGQKLMDELTNSVDEALCNLVEGINEPVVMMMALASLACRACGMVKELGTFEKEVFLEILKDNGYDVRFVEVANE